MHNSMRINYHKTKETLLDHFQSSIFRLIHLIAFITCCHPLMTLISRLGLQEQPNNLDHITVLIAINLPSITSF